MSSQNLNTLTTNFLLGLHQLHGMPQYLKLRQSLKIKSNPALSREIIYAFEGFPRSK